MRALVTGGMGFLGTHLVEALLAQGTNVHVVDNLSTSTVDPAAFRRSLPKPIAFDAMHVDEFCQLESLPRFDEIYHLASIVGPVGVLPHAGAIVRGVVGDTYAVMGLAIRDRADLCEVSTSEVYGGGRNGACAEDDTKLFGVITTRSEYAVAKMASEVALVNTARRTSLLSATIIRPFNIAGPRQGARGGFVIPRFIEQAMANASLTVYGDGSAVRAFTHVKDVAEGIILANRSNAAPPIYNLGNPANKTTILELAQLVIEVVGSKSKIELCDPKRLHGETFAEASDKYPDSDLAQRELRWKPKYDLRTIVSDAYDYIRAGRRD